MSIVILNKSVMLPEDKPNKRPLRTKCLRLAKLLCDEVEDTGDDTQGEFDAAEDIRRMREERVAQLCWNNL